MNDTAPAKRQQRLVRQAIRALKKTAKTMFWDVEPDEDDIKSRLNDCFARSYDDRDALESVIRGVLDLHADWLCGAVRDQHQQAERLALASLPNVQAMARDALDSAISNQ